MTLYAPRYSEGIDHIMKLKSEFEIVELQDDIIAVPVGKDADQLHGVVKLNQSGREIFNMLKNEISEEQIINILTQKYDNRDVIEKYVHSMLADLQQAGVVD